MPVIRLFTTWYNEQRVDRRLEYEYCLKQNLNCSVLYSVHVADESGALQCRQGMQVRQISTRPTYRFFFDWINSLAAPDDLSVIANTDICFDSSMKLLRHIDWSTPLALALSRWDVDSNGKAHLFERGDSQDAWVFRGPVTCPDGAYPLGVYDCDNRIAWELQQAGYRVLNPALGLRIYHHHLCGYRSYEEGPAPDYGIRPPFLYVEPDNLWGPLAAWRLQRRLDLSYFPWRMTSSRFWRYPLPSLMRRALHKCRRSFGR